MLVRRVYSRYSLFPQLPHRPQVSIPRGGATTSDHVVRLSFLGAGVILWKSHLGYIGLQRRK